ncbi:MAG: DUF7448 domain-containing protein [Chitinophagaceae bacterium]
MKIFKKDGKTNFVDDNNVFVGYDTEGYCCEYFGYVLTMFIPNDVDELYSDIKEEILEGYNFDKKFIKNILTIPGLYDTGGAKSFRLEKDKEEVFLTIYNYHNGYYSHGFEFSCDGEIIEEGIL